MTLAQIRRRRLAAIVKVMAALTLAIIVLTPRMDGDATDSRYPADETILAAEAPDLGNLT